MVMLRLSVNITTLVKPVLSVHTLACNRQQPFLNKQKAGNDHRKYFTINLNESMGPGQDQTHDPRVSNQSFY